MRNAVRSVSYPSQKLEEEVTHDFDLFSRASMRAKRVASSADGGYMIQAGCLIGGKVVGWVLVA